MNTNQPKQPKLKLQLTREVVSRLTLDDEALRLAAGGSSSVHVNNWSTWVCGCPRPN